MKNLLVLNLIHIIKAAVIFEGSKLEYKSKKKEDSIDRYKLVNTHTCADINNNLSKDVVDYIYEHYDIDHLKEICFMGDCAKWIKQFPKSSWFKFNSNTINTFSMDGFHFSQALKHLTTNKNNHWYNALSISVKKNNKQLFRKLCSRFIQENKDRQSIIIQKIEYILNNWNERQIYQNNHYLKCSMESHISHIFADLFTSRPKAYSKNGLEKLLKIRLLKVNGYDLKHIYLMSLTKIQKEEIFSSQSNIKHYKLNYHMNQSIYQKEYKLPF